MRKHGRNGDGGNVVEGEPEHGKVSFAIFQFSFIAHFGWNIFYCISLFGALSSLPALFDSQLSCSLREMQFLKCKWCCTFDRFVSEVLWLYTIDNYFRRTWITTSRAAAMPTYGSIWSLELEIEVALLAVCIPKNCNNPHAIAIALK